MICRSSCSKLAAHVSSMLRRTCLHDAGVSAHFVLRPPGAVVRRQLQQSLCLTVHARRRNERSPGGMEVPVAPEVQAVVQDQDPTDKSKRMVALHIGYVGTNYRGARYMAWRFSWQLRPHALSIKRCTACSRTNARPKQGAALLQLGPSAHVCRVAAGADHRSGGYRSGHTTACGETT